jgi:hypothetical protein
MPRVQWPLQNGRPIVQVILTVAQGGKLLPRTLLADTGAGSRRAGFNLILLEHDCLLCGGRLLGAVGLGGLTPVRFLPMLFPFRFLRSDSLDVFVLWPFLPVRLGLTASPASLSSTNSPMAISATRANLVWSVDW